jgi:hypothetical protein
MAGRAVGLGDLLALLNRLGVLADSCSMNTVVGAHRAALEGGREAPARFQSAACVRRMTWAGLA